MSITTTDPLDALLAIRDGFDTARWNFPAAIGTPVADPGGIGEPANITYSFLTAIPDYYDTIGFAPFTFAQKEATRAVLTYLAEVIDVGFTAKASGGQIAFGMDAQGEGWASGYAWFPSFAYGYSGDGIITSVQVSPVGGDVWLNSEYPWVAADFVPGATGYETLLHEMGHALGLKHPFETDSDGFILDPALDNQAYTVMSYNWHPSSGFEFEGADGYEYRWVEPSTLMPYDIAALQYLYGANTATRSGDDTYAFDPFNPTIETIWDGGGVDTISVANFYQACEIDLRAGGYSSLNPGLEDGLIPVDTTDNLAIAFGVTIENSVGGPGNDRLIGNAARNRLDGGAGDDTLLGQGGGDRLLGGTGHDTLRGGAGKDILTAGYGNDRLLGEGGNDLLKGGKGQDSLTGGLGADIFRFDTPLNASTNVDRIADFTLADDRFQLENGVFKALTTTGTLIASAFGTWGAADDSDRILYDPGAGGLYYDPDGSGAGVAVKFAQLASGLGLTALHFVVT